MTQDSLLQHDLVFIGSSAFPLATLKNILPDVETALFFAKIYELDYEGLASLLHLVFHTEVTAALTQGSHSTELQSYLVGIIPDDVLTQPIDYVSEPPKAMILPEVWADLEIEVASSIKTVAERLKTTVQGMPSKQGAMVFQHLNKLNRQRPTIGTFAAGIQHKIQAPNLVILDVSGSMSAETIRSLVDEVVSLAWTADAHLVIVSDNAFHWEPGTYTSSKVLKAAEYWGTHYEELIPVLRQDWGTVVTIADYDSSGDVLRVVKKERDAGRMGTIQQVFDISLVNRRTFLSEVVGALAKNVRPILIANSNRVLK